MTYILFYIIIISISLLALGQGYSYIRSKTVRGYFREKSIQYLLVCNDSSMFENWKDKIDLELYGIIDISKYSSNQEFILNKFIEKTVYKVGVQKYPCLLSIDDYGINGNYFEQSTN